MTQPTPPSQPKLWGCDWTWRQGVCPAKRIEEEGFTYVWLKASGAQAQGGYFEDPTFNQSMESVLSTNLIPGAFHYLMPGRAGGQAAHFSDQMRRITGDDSTGIMCKLDVEQPGVTAQDIARFCEVWEDIEGRNPLWIYTNKHIWTIKNQFGSIGHNNPLLEEAHWIAAEFRQPGMPATASEQYKKINPAWWETNYGGWPKASMIQFSNYALIAGVRQMASVFHGRKTDLERVAGLPH